MFPSNSRKRPRVPPHHNYHRPSSSSRAASSAALVDSITDKTITETSQKLRRTASHPILPLSSPFTTTTAAVSSVSKFNDPATADVSLLLEGDSSTLFSDAADSISSAADSGESDLFIYLHSTVIRRANYFSAVLSDRWRNNNQIFGDDNCNKIISLKLKVPPTPRAIYNHFVVMELLYTNDFNGVINSVETALDILPIALKLLFEDCVKSCVRFLEAVPWSEEEEERVISLIPLLDNEISKQLLARVSPDREGSCEEMLHGLIVSAIHNNPNMAFVKAFVAKLLRDFSSRESATTVLERAFGETLKIVKESVENYLSPDFRGDHNETEAIQRLNLHATMMNGRHLLWLVERMIELRGADCALKEWSEMGGFTADLQRVFREDVWRNISPGLPTVMLRCTFKLANAVASGSILAARQVRMKLVKQWLPILIVCKENISSLLPSHKSLCLELEETFLRIISTLPMSDAQALLQQCLSFSTRNVEDCPHLVSAFHTWFRRATRPPQIDKI